MAITLTKTGSLNPVVVGQNLSYTIIINSLGPGPANNVVLTDVLPATVTFVSASVPCTLVGNILTCSLGSLPAGTTQTVTITVLPTAPGMITNVATAQGSGQNMAQDVETTQVLAVTTLTLTKTDTPDPAFVGGTLTYTLAVTNTGTSPAVDVVLSDLLPAQVDFLSASVPCTLLGSALSCNLGTIPAGATATVTIQVRPNAPGTAINLATAAGVNSNTATASSTTTLLLAADLAVTKTANAKAQVNQGLTYTVTVTNNGPSTATGVTLVDDLPASVRFIVATPSQGTCSIAGPRLTCLIGTLAPGQTETVTILVVPTRPGFLTNTARVFSDVLDPNPANNTASLTTAVFQCCTGFPC